MSLAGQRILITGATGFIGGRLAQWLHEVAGARVVALVRSFKTASRLSRFPVELRHGDVTDRDAVRAAARQCDAIVHAAVSFASTPAENRRVTIAGAENVCRAAKDHDVRRLVYLSTISVYGTLPEGPFTEQTPCLPSDAYGRDKLDAESIFARAAGGGQTCVTLRLPVVYGPWAYWTLHPIAQLRRGRVVLPDDGNGLCNALYVDDAARAIVCALRASLGEPSATCLVGGPAPVTWRQYYEGHAQALATPADLRFLPRAELAMRLPSRGAGFLHLPRRLWELRHEYRIVMRVPGVPTLNRSLRAWKHRYFSSVQRRQAAASQAVVDTCAAPHNATGNRADILPDAAHLDLMASRAVIDPSHARELLGYRGEIPFDEGVRRSAAWYRWAYPAGDSI